MIEAPFAFVLDRFDIQAEDTPGEEHCTPEVIEIRAYDPYTGLWPQLLYYNLIGGNGPRFNPPLLPTVLQKVTVDVDAGSSAYSKYAFVVRKTVGSSAALSSGTSTTVRVPELTFYRRGVDLDAGQRLAPDLSNPKHPPVPLTSRITDDPVYGRFKATSDSQFGPIWQPNEGFDAFTGFTSTTSGWKSGVDSYLNDGTFNPASPNLTAQQLVSGVFGAWLSIELPYTIFLKSLTLFPLNTGANSIGVNQFPSAINVYGTNALDPGQSDWTLLAALTGLSVPDTVTSLSRAVDAPAAYRRFALVILSTQNSGISQSHEAGLGEVELYSKQLGDKVDTTAPRLTDVRLDGSDLLFDDENGALKLAVPYQAPITAGDGLDFTGNTLNAQVTQAELDAKRDAADPYVASASHVGSILTLTDKDGGTVVVPVQAPITAGAGLDFAGNTLNAQVTQAELDAKLAAGTTGGPYVSSAQVLDAAGPGPQSLEVRDKDNGVLTTFSYAAATAAANGATLSIQGNEIGTDAPSLTYVDTELGLKRDAADPYVEDFTVGTNETTGEAQLTLTKDGGQDTVFGYVSATADADNATVSFVGVSSNELKVDAPSRAYADAQLALKRDAADPYVEDFTVGTNETTGEAQLTLTKDGGQDTVFGYVSATADADNATVSFVGVSSNELKVDAPSRAYADAQLALRVTDWALEMPPGPFTADTTNIPGYGVFEMAVSSVFSEGDEWKIFDKQDPPNFGWLGGNGKYDAATGDYLGSTQLGTGTSLGEYLIFDAPFDFFLDRYEVTTWAGGGNTNASVRQSEVYGWDAATSTWDLLAAPAPHPWSNYGQVERDSSPAQATKAYRRYALVVLGIAGTNVTGSGIATNVRIPELIFFRKPFDPHADVERKLDASADRLVSAAKDNLGAGGASQLTLTDKNGGTVVFGYSSASPSIAINGNKVSAVGKPLLLGPGHPRVPPLPLTGGTTALAGHGDFVATASSSASGADPWKAFDGEEGSGWFSAAGLYNAASGAYEGSAQLSAGLTQGEYLVLEAPYEFVLERFEVGLWGSDSETNCAAKQVEVYGHNRLTGAWDLLSTVADLLALPARTAPLPSEAVVAVDVTGAAGRAAFSEYAVVVAATVGQTLRLPPAPLSGLITRLGHGDYVATFSNVTTSPTEPWTVFDLDTPNNRGWVTDTGLYDGTTGAYKGGRRLAAETSEGEYVILDMPVSVRIQDYSVSNWYQNNYLDTTIRGVELVGFDSSAGLWDILHTDASIAWTQYGDQETKTFAVNSTKAYSRVAVIALSTAGENAGEDLQKNGSLRVSEISFTGKNAGTATEARVPRVTLYRAASLSTADATALSRVATGPRVPPAGLRGLKTLLGDGLYSLEASSLKAGNLAEEAFDYIEHLYDGWITDSTYDDRDTPAVGIGEYVGTARLGDGTARGEWLTLECPSLSEIREVELIRMHGSLNAEVAPKTVRFYGLDGLDWVELAAVSNLTYDDATRVASFEVSEHEPMRKYGLVVESIFAGGGNNILRSTRLSEARLLTRGRLKRAEVVNASGPGPQSLVLTDTNTDQTTFEYTGATPGPNEATVSVTGSQIGTDGAALSYVDSQLAQKLDASAARVSGATHVGTDLTLLDKDGAGFLTVPVQAPVTSANSSLLVSGSTLTAVPRKPLNGPVVFDTDQVPPAKLTGLTTTINGVGDFVIGYSSHTPSVTHGTFTGGNLINMWRTAAGRYNPDGTYAGSARLHAGASMGEYVYLDCP
ncbi:MAG: hypothetical protein ACO38I_09395, partial [Ilumatobacteraceae bacterium]